MTAAMPTPPNTAAENRRVQLRRWIDRHFAGLQADFIKSTNDGTTQINQGELSGLLASKSFGEKRARRLEQQAKMPAGYLDQPANTAAAHFVAQAGAVGTELNDHPTGWPFAIVSPQRLRLLRRGLGPHLGQEAMRDIDESLDIVVTKWEKRLERKKSAAA